MADFSNLFGALFKKDLQTHTYTLGSETIALTPTGLTPAELVIKLYENGAKLVVIGDNSHSEPRIPATLNSLLGDKTLKITHFASEVPSIYQQKYNDFMNGNEKGLRDLISLSDYHAPNVRDFPELRKQFFTERLKTYEVTRSNGIKVGFVDHTDNASSRAADNAHNKFIMFRRDFVIAKSLRDEQGKPLDIEHFSIPELDKIKRKIITGLKRERIGTDSDAAIMNTDASTFVDIARDLFRDIKLPYASPHTTEAIIKASQARYDILYEAREIAETKRDDIRNQQMVKNIEGLIQQGNPTNQRTLFMVGEDHLGKKKEKAGVPSLEEMIRSKYGSKAVRVDIVPVSTEEAKKLGVAIGGRKNSDYTIFIPSDGLTSYLFKDTGKSVPAKDGPHKEKLKPLKLSQSSEQIIVAHDSSYIPDTNFFDSGLVTALPKAPPTKTV